MIYNIDKYLNMIGYNLQLPDNKFEELNNSYKAICTYISNNHKLAESEEFSIYYQGSFAIDTAIRPLKNDDFDVDIVVEFDMSKKDMSPVDFYNELLSTFKTGRYANMVKTHRNSIEIDYDTNYHFDIMPSIPLAYNSDSLNVPNVKKVEWVIRSPKRYKEWFIEQTNKIKGYRIKVDKNRFLLEYQSTPLEKPKPYEIKPTLNRVVQLIKRARDVYFKDVEECIPQSIVLTTLAARFYDGEASIFEAIYNITHKMFKLNDIKNFTVYNPACNGHQENFTEKWLKNPNYYKNYKNFTSYLLENLEEIKTNNSIKALKNIFGETIIDKVKEDTKYDTIWIEPKKIISQNVFPNKEVKINKKERGNA